MLIVTEGTVTEIQYIEELAQHLRSTGVLVRGTKTKGMGKDPLKVVNEAIDQRDNFDEAWAIVDVDAHAKLPAAIIAAKRNSLPMVISNPCFEMWLVWHYSECAAYQSKEDLDRKLAKHGHTEKQIPGAFPYAQVTDAERRAAATHPGQHAMGENPSSSMGDLIAAMRRP